MSQYNWKWWFAWYPVKVIPESGNCWVWCVFVQRRELNYVAGNKILKIVEYR